MKQWYTPKELTSLRLSGLPSNIANINRLAERENWRTQSNLLGEPLSLRDQKGGGWRYHISLLPQSARDDLSFREMKSNPDLRPLKVATPKAKAPVEKAMERDAKLEIVASWENYRTSKPGNIEILMVEFVTLYKNKKIVNISSAVYETIDSFTTRTLRNWVKGAKGKGADGVLDKRGRKKGTSLLATAFHGDLAHSIKAWIAKESKLTVRQIRDMVIVDYGEEFEITDAKTGELKTKTMPSEREFSRFIKEFKENNKALIAKITNPDQFKSHYRMAIGKYDEAVTIPNQVWEFDASPADILVEEGRYNIYVLVDVATRRMIVSVTDNPRTNAALHLVRIAIERWGMPEWIRSDNGSDFISYGMRSALSALGIHHDVCPPYSPEKKPMVERGIGTLQRDLMPTLDGFIGHDVADRKMIEARRSFAERLGEKDQGIAVVKLTYKQLQDKINGWTDSIYANTEHRGLNGLTPNEAYRAYDGPIHIAEDLASLLLLMAPIGGQKGYRYVSKKGIRLEGRYYWGNGLDAGQRVFCRHDPLDETKIAIFSENQADFLCMAECLDYMTGPERQSCAKQAKHEQTQRLAPEFKSLRKAANNFNLDEYSTKREALYEKRAENKAGNVADLPKRTIPVTTPQMDAAAEAFGKPKETLKPVLTQAEKELREALIIDLESRKKQPEEKRLTAEDRFNKAINLEEKIKAGNEISQNDVDWLKRYSKSPEYRSRMELLKEFPPQGSQSEAG